MRIQSGFLFATCQWVAACSGSGPSEEAPSDSPENAATLAPEVAGDASPEAIRLFSAYLDKNGKVEQCFGDYTALESGQDWRLKVWT